MVERLMQKKRYIVVIGMLIATVPLVCLLLFIKFSFIDELEQNAIQLRQTFAVAATQIIDERLEAEIAFGSAFTTRRSLQQALVNGNRPELVYHLKAMKDLSSSMERFYVTTVDGTMQASYPVDPAIVGKDFSHRDWYQQTIRKQKPYVSDFFLRAVKPQQYIFIVSIPIKSATGATIGILVMEPKDDFIRTAIDDIKTGGSGAIYVVDKQGALVFHQQFAVDRLINYATVPVVGKVNRGLSGAELGYNPLTKQEEVAAYHPIPRSGWGVITVQPLHEILQPLYRMELGLYLFIGSILLLAGYNAFKWATMLLESQRLASELELRTDELETANTSLQHQAEELEMQAEELQSQNEELQAQGEELEMQTEELFQRNDELEQLRQALATSNEQLELKVQERMAALTEEIDRHRITEQQLRQAQKMEAIGQLAGGVAHDFNNILTVIDGYGSLMLQDLPTEGQLKTNLEQILAASDKAANLTRSLLAFSRKQVMNPMPVDLNLIVGNVVKFLRRILGEDIRLETITRTDRLPIFADSVQIEQVLLNLATNARDAMPKGGALTIETDLQELDDSFVKLHEFATPPGIYAVIIVADNGNGMNEETRKKIFEPFFTTKDVGKGTGLGLSMVYGIVKQHHGYINVYSELGNGSTFRIYLPATIEQVVVEELQLAPTLPVGGTETILLAEDDPMVRTLMETILHNHGYEVIVAVDGQDAVDKFSAYQDKIELVLLDVIMPRKNGKLAYDEIRQLKPAVKILFASGYTADFIQHQVDFVEEVELIMKPVKPQELIKKVSEVLGR